MGHKKYQTISSKNIKNQPRFRGTEWGDQAQKPHMEPELHGDLFFGKIEMAFVSFKKIGNKIPGGDIVELYHCEKPRLKICYILGYTKMTNFQLFKLCTVHHT
jgi:hypothetical protein